MYADASSQNINANADFVSTHEKIDYGLPPVTIQKTGQWSVFCIFAARSIGKNASGPQKHLIIGLRPANLWSALFAPIFRPPTYEQANQVSINLGFLQGWIGPYSKKTTRTGGENIFNRGYPTVHRRPGFALHPGRKSDFLPLYFGGTGKDVTPIGFWRNPGAERQSG